MGLEAALLNARDRLQTCAHLLEALQRAIDDRTATSEGRAPTRRRRRASEEPDHLLYGRMYDAEMKVTGWIMEAHEAIEKARLHFLEGPDLPALRRALALCEARFKAACEGWSSEIASNSNLQELRQLRTRQSTAWGPWVEEVLAAIGPLQPACNDAADALARCWHELAEYAGAGVVIKNVAIGQINDTRISADPTGDNSEPKEP